MAQKMGGHISILGSSLLLSTFIVLAFPNESNLEVWGQSLNAERRNEHTETSLVLQLR